VPLRKASRNGGEPMMLDHGRAIRVKFIANRTTLTAEDSEGFAEGAEKIQSSAAPLRKSLYALCG